MKIVKEDFDSEKFAEYAQSEAKKYLPERMRDLDKKFILDTFKNFALRSANVLSQDMSLNIDSYEKIVARAKYILEWIFKTSVALVETDCPIECRHGFMLDVGFVAFEVTKDMNTLNDASEEQIKATVEYHVINKIKKMLAELQLSGIITDKMREDFLNHPYMDKSQKNIDFAIYG